MLSKSTSKSSGINIQLIEIHNQLVVVNQKQDVLLGKLLELEQTLNARDRNADLRSAGNQSAFLTTAEAAAIAKRTPETIRDWIANGILTGHRPPGAGARSPLLVSRAELMERLVSEGCESQGG